MHRPCLNCAAVTTVSILTVFLWNCSQDSPTGPGKSEDIRFPLAIGNEWVYRCSYSRVSESASDTTSESSTGEITWKIAAFEEILGQEAYRMEVTQRVTSGPDSGNVFTFNTWYAERDSMLVATANESTAGHAPFSFGQLHKRTIPKSEIYPWGITVLKYPLSMGAEWQFSNLYASDTKKVEARDRITVNGREFDTVRVVRNLDLDTIGSVPGKDRPFHSVTTQWYAPEGLVKATGAADGFTDTLSVHDVFIQELFSVKLE